jgi:tetratricopeptide (TPR) repeat protein
MNLWTDAEAVVDRVVNALNGFDWAEVERQCQALTKRLNEADGPFPEPEARRILKALRRKRQFPAMALVADALIGSGRNEAEIHRFYGQAQIDQGQLNAAEVTLQAIAANPGTPRREWAEALGLLGRICKQRYMDARQPESARQQGNLRQAISYYNEVYKSDPPEYPWQGINVVALLARAERDGVDVSQAGLGGFRPIAGEILERLRKQEDKKGSLFYWDRATAMEACVALNDLTAARSDLREYMTDLEVDAFECGSTLRQLREVWQIDDGNGPGGLLIAGLRSTLLKRQGGEVELRYDEVQQGLQANFSSQADLPLAWWRSGLERCAAVARVEDLGGRHIGTGFLVRREDFLGDASGLLLLTNWHVVSEGAEHPLSIAPEAAQATFEAGGRTFKVARNMPAYSRALDASFLELEPGGETPGHCPLEPPAAEFDIRTNPRVYVIGYPGGRGLSFSVHDSNWLDTDGVKLHYRTPTEPSSSGSPVFDQRFWTLVALHHSGRKDMPRLNGQPGTYEANEGFSVSAIRAAVRSTPKS